jgi:phosphoribosylglycinamide formyltransferase 1
MKKIAIFASGSGTNAQKIIEFFNEKPVIGKVEIIFSNKKDAYVLERAKSFNISSCIFSREEFYHTDYVQNILIKHDIDLIVLAGFLWLVPQNVLQHYPKQIINIHPALLPKYGGKGMFGARVHEAVIKNKDEYSGITIHYVNEHYDEGDIIFQAKCKVDPNDTAESLAEKIHALEYEYYPRTIEEILVRF